MRTKKLKITAASLVLLSAAGITVAFAKTDSVSSLRQWYADAFQTSQGFIGSQVQTFLSHSKEQLEDDGRQLKEQALSQLEQEGASAANKAVSQIQKANSVYMDGLTTKTDELVSGKIDSDFDKLVLNQNEEIDRWIQKTMNEITLAPSSQAVR
jgi:hypothetical protein